MFTGLIEGIGTVKSVRRVREDIVMMIVPPFHMKDCKVGESISVDGVCLTITTLRQGTLTMDVSAETFSRSTLGRLRPGDEVNLERSLRLSDRLGGHLVSGHVDGTGKILQKTSRQGSWMLRIGVGEILSRYLVEKGSVAVDGISLTVNRCEKTFFEVNIVPHTSRETAILKKKVGDLVNIENDLIGKYVEKFLEAPPPTKQSNSPSAIDREMLIKYGFGG